MSKPVTEPQQGELIPKNDEGLMDPRFLGPGPTEPVAGIVPLPDRPVPNPAEATAASQPEEAGGAGLVDPRSTLRAAAEPERPAAPPAKPEPPPRPEQLPRPGFPPERPMAPIPEGPQSPPPEPPAPPTWGRTGDDREAAFPRQWASPAQLAMVRSLPAWQKTRARIAWPRRPVRCYA